MYESLRGSDVRLRGTNEAVVTRTAMHPLKILALVGAAFLMWGLLFAYASSPAQAATLTVTSLSDTTANDGRCTLREAIFNANANDQSGSTDCAPGSGSDVIDIGVTGTVNLTGALPNLSSNLQIEGPGADQFTVRRDTGVYRIFHVTSGSVVSISGITISGGDEPQGLGGGILNFGTLTVSGSTVSGNRATRGGGIFNDSILTITGSTISGNYAVTGGGVESVNGLLSNTFSDTTTITNSTISGNTASNRGGGVNNFDGLTVIENSTITNNTAPSGEGSGVASAGDSGVRTEVLSSIISANPGNDVVVNGYRGFIPNTFSSKGYNLIGNGNAISAFNQSGDRTNVGDPKLGALSDNGGPTETHALLPASPARDAIPSGTNGCGTTFTQDQRGVSRPQGDACDIGAFELTTITVNSLEEVTDDDGKCTLWEAITAANNNERSGTLDGECAAGSGAGNDLVELGATGTVNLTRPLPELSSDLQLRGPGADRFTVRRDTGDDYRIFHVTSGSKVSISGITISNGSVPASFGGGIFNDGGTLEITDSTISANQGNRGGGVANRRGTLTVSGSTISGNRAGDEGGGVFSDTFLSGTQKTTITNSTISGNSATDTGGGVNNFDGLSVIENSTITNNTAPDGRGSGVASRGDEEFASTEVLSSIISENTNTDVDYLGVPGISTNSFDSNGYNLIGDGNATDAFGQSSDQKNVDDPKLGALANNGGPTETHALLAGSPAIDKGNTDLATDQRGKPRSFNDPSIAPATGGDNSDIGSFEAQSVLISMPQAEDDAYSTDEDTTLTRDASTGVLSNDTDDATLTAELVEGVDHGTLTLDPDGSFTYSPNADYNDQDSFTYKATDGTAESDPATVTISVKAVNDAPSFTSGGDVSVAADSGAYSKAWATEISAGPANETTQKLTFDITGITNTALFSSGPQIAPDGTLEFTPAANANGSASVTAVLNDDGGTTTGGVNSSAPVTFGITLTPVNDAPVATDDNATADEDSPATIQVLANDTDPDSDALSVSSFTQPSHGTVSQNVDDTLKYAPDKNYNGPDSITYKASDGTADSNLATVEIDVNAINDAPRIKAVAGSASRSACLSDTRGRVTLKLSDVDDTVGSLTLGATSSNTGLVPNAGVVFSGSASTRTAAIATVAGSTGSSIVRIKASDGQASRTVPVTVKAGGKAANALTGTLGADLLLGRNGDDTLGGAGGNDVLCGAGGDDTLTGGTEADSFDGGSGTDRATDFNASGGDSRTNIP